MTEKSDNPIFLLTPNSPPNSPPLPFKFTPTTIHFDASGRIIDPAIYNGKWGQIPVFTPAGPRTGYFSDIVEFFKHPIKSITNP